MGLALLDLSAREEKVSAQDDNESKTTWIIGACSTRQMFGIYSKFGQTSKGEDTLSVEAQVGMAYEMVRLGLKDVKGELSEGFTLVDSLAGKVACEDYLDRLPLPLIIEIGGWVAEASQIGAEGKKV